MHLLLVVQQSPNTQTIRVQQPLGQTVLRTGTPGAVVQGQQGKQIIVHKGGQVSSQPQIVTLVKTTQGMQVAQVSGMTAPYYNLRWTVRNQSLLACCWYSYNRFAANFTVSSWMMLVFYTVSMSIAEVSVPRQKHSSRRYNCQAGDITGGWSDQDSHHHQ